MARPAFNPAVYLVTDTALCGGPAAVVSTVLDAVAGGVTLVQLREPGASDAELVALGRDLIDALAPTGVPLIVNDRVDLVDAIGAHGAHVGQGDLPIAEARAMLGPDRLLGLSVTNPAEVRTARAGGEGVLDYLGAQSLRPTGTKPEAGAVGLATIAACAEASPWPVVAIGGVVATDAPALVGRGIAGMAVVSAVCGRPNPRAAASELAASWHRALVANRGAGGGCPLRKEEA